MTKQTASPSLKWDGKTIAVALPMPPHGNVLEAKWEPTTTVVRIKKAGAEKWMCGIETPLTHVSFLELEPDSDYEVEVRHKNRHNEGPPTTMTVSTKKDGSMGNIIPLAAPKDVNPTSKRNPQWPYVTLFSWRERPRNGDVPDVYTYDRLPDKLRVQIVQICRAAIGRFHSYSGYELGDVTENNQGWQIIHDAVAREHGVFELSSRHAIDERCAAFILECDSVDEVIDLVEVSFRYIDRVARTFKDYDRERCDITQEVNLSMVRCCEKIASHSGRLLRSLANSK